MGHRALVAIEQADGLYDLHHSQWGALDFALAPTLADATVRIDAVESVAPAPFQTGVDPSRLWDHVDPLLYEAVYVRTSDSLRTYLPTALDVAGDDCTPLGVAWDDPTLLSDSDEAPAGVAIEVRPGTDDPAYVRGFVAGAKEALACRDGSDDRCESLVAALSALSAPDREVVPIG